MKTVSKTNNMLKYCLLVTIGLIAGVQSKTCTHNTVFVSFPEAVKPGDSVELFCNYNTRDQPLDNVKWYKGDAEFFRYVPNEIPSFKVFPVEGVLVNEESTAGRVILQSVQDTTSGNYTCEVTSIPRPLTIRHSSFLHVVKTPKGQPVLNVDNDFVGLGDVVHAICASPPSFPPAEITWRLNGEKVKYGVSSNRHRELNGSPVVTTSFLILDVRYDTFTSSRVNKANLTCIAGITGVYEAQKTVVLERDPSPRFHQHAMSGVSPTGFARMDIVVIALLSLYWFKY